MSIQDILNNFSLADQYKRSTDTGLGGYEMQPERRAQAEALPIGAASMVIDLPLGLAETVFNIGKNVVAPFEEVEYTKFPRLAKEDLERVQQEGGPMATAMTFVGGFGAGAAIGSIPVVSDILFAGPLENAIANTASKYFVNPTVGESLVGQIANKGAEITTNVSARIIGGGTANVVADSGYNLAEATDEQGNVDFKKFADLEVQSGLFGGLFGAGGSLVDKGIQNQIKDFKGLVKEALIGAEHSNKAAIEKNAKQRQQIQEYEQQRQLQEQMKEVREAEALDAPIDEVQVVEEVVDLNEKNMDWAQEYQAVRDRYDEEVGNAEEIVEPSNKKEATLKEIIDQAKAFYREIREPIFREMEQLSPFGKMAKRKEVRQKIKTGARLTEARQFAQEYDKAFKQKSILSKLGDFGKKVSGKKTDEQIFHLAVSNGRFDDARAILGGQENSTSLLKGFDNMLKIYDDIGQEAVNIGLMHPESLKENYWARYVKDPDKFQKEIFGKLDAEDQSYYKTLLDQKKQELNRNLTPRERAQLLEGYLKNRAQATRRSGHMKQRRLENIEANMLKYYADPVSALKQYIVDMTESVELTKLIKMKDPMYEPKPSQIQKRMEKLKAENNNIDPEILEKEAIRSLHRDNMIKDPNRVITEQDINTKYDQLKKQQEDGRWQGYEDDQLKEVAEELLKDSSIPNQIEAKVNYLVTSGKLDGANASRYKELLEAAYVRGKESRPAFAQSLSNFGYGAVLGNFNSAMTQLKDIAPTMSRYGVRKALSTYLRSLFSTISDGKIGNIKYSLDELGLEKILDELYGVNTEAKSRLVDVFLAPLGFVDKIGRQGAIESSLKSWQEKAGTEKGLAELKKKYGEVFTPEEFNQLNSALINKEDHWTVRDLLVYEIGEIYPTSALDKPKAYLDNPRSRILYDLQNFAIKRQDYIYNELLKRAREGDTGPLLKFLVMAPLVSYSVESARDSIRKKDDDNNVIDKAFFAAADTLGLNQLAYTALRPSTKRDQIAALQSTFVTFPPMAVTGALDIGWDVAGLATGTKAWDEIYSTRYIPYVGPYIKPFSEEIGKSPMERSMQKRYEGIGKRYENLGKRYSQ